MAYWGGGTLRVQRLARFGYKQKEGAKERDLLSQMLSEVPAAVRCSLFCFNSFSQPLSKGKTRACLTLTEKSTKTQAHCEANQTSSCYQVLKQETKACF